MFAEAITLATMEDNLGDCGGGGKKTLRRWVVSLITCPCAEEREIFIDNLLVRIHYIIVMIGWTGLAPWEFEFPFPGSLTSTFLPCCAEHAAGAALARGDLIWKQL